MWVYDCPFDRVPDEISLPESEATVCGAESWFVQVTVAPALTVNVDGAKAKFWMLTVSGVVDDCVLPADWVPIQPEKASTDISNPIYTPVPTVFFILMPRPFPYCTVTVPFIERCMPQW
jgi:hypothetical protein